MVCVHIVCWAVFLSLPSIFNPRRAELGSWWLILDILEPPRWTNALLLIVVFYFNYYIAIPKLYIKHKYFSLLLSVGVLSFVFIWLNYSMRPPEFGPHIPSGPGVGLPPGPPPDGPPPFGLLGNSFNLFMFLIVYAASFALCLYEQWQKTKEEMLNTQISLLKRQINPHFLFNTLNSIYSLTLTKSDSAPDAVVKLAGMMRYSVSDATQNTVSLSKEIEYISNYIDLQRLRVAENVKIAYSVSGSVDGRQIAPFLLIPFVEQAFRYGVNSEQDSDIRIEMYIDSSNILLTAVNKKVFMRADDNADTLSAVETTKKRLNLLYPGKHKFEVRDDEQLFSISLQISL